MSLLIESVRRQIKATEFRFDMRRPCDDCPFRRNAECHVGIAEQLFNYSKALETGMLGHTCHKTDGRADGPRAGQPNDVVQHCAGAIIMQMKASEIPFPKLILEAIGDGLITENELLDMAIDDENVVDSLSEMFETYSDWLGREYQKRSEGRKKAVSPDTPPGI